MSDTNNVGSETTRDNPCEKYTPRKYVPRRLEESSEVSAEDTFLRKLKGNFNKITPKNADTIIVQIVDSLQEISTNNLSPQTWEDAAKAILQRAIAEPNNLQTYVTLCTKIANQFPGVLVPNDSGGLKFGDLFAPAYNCELQQRLSVKGADEDLLCRMKEKMLTATKFIGELGKKSFMFTNNNNILAPVCQLLAFLEDSSCCDNYSPMNCMCIECACTLVNTVGKTVDMCPCEMSEKTFAKIQDMSENKTLPARLRFMAKGIVELRSNRWLPRILTKKNDDVPSIPVSSSPSPAPPSPAIPEGDCSPPSNHNGTHKERDPSELHDMSVEDADLGAAMENLVQKMNGKSDSCVATIMRKFMKSISSDHAKVLASVLAENPELVPVPPRPEKLFLRRSSMQLPTKPASPQALSRNFHAIINLIKLNSSSTFSDEVNQALVTKISTLKASELIEVVGSIFRKMCEMPEDYNYCLNICLTLSSNARTTPHSFQETLEHCCQDETAIKMFNTQASINTYLQLVKDLERELGMDPTVVKRCVGNVQNGLYELNDQEASLLASLETLVSETTSGVPTTPSPVTPLPSPAPFVTASLTPPAPPPLSPPPLSPPPLSPPEVTERSKGRNEEQQSKQEDGGQSEGSGIRARSRGSDSDSWSHRC